MKPAHLRGTNNGKSGAVLLGTRELSLTLDRQTHALLTSMAKRYPDTTPLSLAQTLMHNAIHSLAIQLAQEHVALVLCSVFACAVWR